MTINLGSIKAGDGLDALTGEPLRRSRKVSIPALDASPVSIRYCVLCNAAPMAIFSCKAKSKGVRHNCMIVL